ncbi:hypothetical protein GGS26DRAFT_352203 [Hypomontagnella submonticulosa]|nr:hypothetical protein GGS26DRAFT_352203 [Hypomontagnella submonticulosa]
MADVYCACVISNIEGMRSANVITPIPADFDSTLEALDSRVRRLEASFRVTPPPPLTDASWDSLTWRVCRLSRSSSGTGLKKAPALGNAASLPLLKSAIATINTQSRVPWPGDDAVGEKQFLGLAAQWLCHYAGQRRVEIKDPSFQLEHVCCLALDLCLETEAGFPRTAPYGRPAGPMGVPPLPPSIHPKKACCGCCSCHCHKNSRSRDSSVDSDASSRRGRWSAFGWVKKLAFWRKKRVMDDDSSMGTIVD